MRGFTPGAWPGGKLNRSFGLCAPFAPRIQLRLVGAETDAPSSSESL